MRFAFIADIPDWALHRQGLGLVKYGAVDGHTWDLLHVRPADFEPDDLFAYDAIRLGGTGVLYYMHTQGMFPTWQRAQGKTLELPKVICSLASFRDEPEYREVIEHFVEQEQIDAFCTVDHRLLAQCAAYSRAAVHVPDRTDPATFKPMPELRPTSGPLRVGWAGSVAFWPTIKHVDAIEVACNLVDGVTFVRQDRELDGQKTAEEMAAWFNGLDLYCSANDHDTPTPVPWIEAAACGVPVIGTRCGELWQLAHAASPSSIVVNPSAVRVAEALRRAVRAGRPALHRRGLAFQERFRYFLYWDLGVAREFTRFVAALCGAEPPEVKP